MEQLPFHGPCLVCGDAPHSFGFTFYKEGDRIIALGKLTRAQQGPPGHAHGGSLAAVLDEAMGRALWDAGHAVVAANLEVNYRHPTPLETPLRVEAWHEGRRKRSIAARAELMLPDGTVAVDAKGIFVELGEKFFETFGDFWGRPPQAAP